MGTPQQLVARNRDRCSLPGGSGCQEGRSLVYSGGHEGGGHDPRTRRLQCRGGMCEQGSRGGRWCFTCEDQVLMRRGRLGFLSCKLTLEVSRDGRPDMIVRHDLVKRPEDAVLYEDTVCNRISYSCFLQFFQTLAQARLMTYAFSCVLFPRLAFYCFFLSILRLAWLSDVG